MGLYKKQINFVNVFLVNLDQLHVIKNLLIIISQNIDIEGVTKQKNDSC